MIVDIDEYFRPEISIIDAVVGMEGNGPTAGDAKHMDDTDVSFLDDLLPWAETIPTICKK